MSFAGMLKNRREVLGLTLEEIGKAVGVARGTVQRWESGEIGNPRRDKMAALARVLEVELKDLLDDSAIEDKPADRNAEIVIRMVKQMTPEESGKMRGVAMAVFGDVFDEHGRRRNGSDGK